MQKVPSLRGERLATHFEGQWPKEKKRLFVALRETKVAMTENNVAGKTTLVALKETVVALRKNRCGERDQALR